MGMAHYQFQGHIHLVSVRKIPDRSSLVLATSFLEMLDTLFMTKAMRVEGGTITNAE